MSKQLNFTSIIFPTVIVYRLPDLDNPDLRGLVRVMLTAFANHWDHLGELALEQIKGLVGSHDR
jgi:hypothetical protein